jgi:hypothetical protein
VTLNLSRVPVFLPGLRWCLFVAGCTRCASLPVCRHPCCTSPSYQRSAMHGMHVQSHAMRTGAAATACLARHACGAAAAVSWSHHACEAICVCSTAWMLDERRHDRPLFSLHEVWHALRCNFPTRDTFEADGLQQLLDLLQSSNACALSARLHVYLKGVLPALPHNAAHTCTACVLAWRIL